MATTPVTARVWGMYGARSRNVAVTLVLAGLFTIGVFARGVPTGASTGFDLSAAPAVPIPSFAVPSALTALLCGIACVALGGLQALRRTERHAYGILALGLAIFGFAFLTWAGQSRSVNFIDILSTSLIETVPLSLGAFSGVLCERSGVINIAIEGQFLVAAFTSAVIASATQDPWLGLVAGAVSGALVGALLALLTITYAADQIIVGVVIDAFALGLTSFFDLSVLVPNQATLNSPPVFRPIAIPLLDKIPIVGPVLFDETIFVYLTAGVLIALQIGLFRTRWGLRVRAVGEHPRAADTVGINVTRIRYLNVIVGGAVAGIGGAAFTVGGTGQFTPNMTAGLGYIALAAMIFGRWQPLGALAAAFLFGFTDALQFALSVLNVPIPSDFLTMLPYLATIVAVAGLVGQVRPPAADGQPYARE